MRDIYTHGIITSDFVLVMGDLVSNVKIDEVVRIHKERRKTNKDAIMTMVVKESGASHRTRCVYVPQYRVRPAVRAMFSRDAFHTARFLLLFVQIER